MLEIWEIKFRSIRVEENWTFFFLIFFSSTKYKVTGEERNSQWQWKIDATLWKKIIRSILKRRSFYFDNYESFLLEERALQELVTLETLKEFFS